MYYFLIKTFYINIIIIYLGINDMYLWCNSIVFHSMDLKKKKTVWLMNNDYDYFELLFL